MNRMTHGKNGRIALALGLPGLLVVPGCLAVTDVSLNDIVGDWVATQARLAIVANINETVDITDLGWEVTLQIDGDGAYILTLDEPGAPLDVRTGTILVENGKDLIVTGPAGNVGEGEVFQEGDQIAIMFDKFSGLAYDIYRDGNLIPVTLLLVMVRQ